MKTKIEFAFGIEFDKNGARINRSDALMAVARLVAELAHRAGGCTAFAQTGSWRGPDGKLVSEQGFTLSTVLGPENLGAGRIVRETVESIKRRLNLQAVAVTKTVVNFDVW